MNQSTQKMNSIKKNESTLDFKYRLSVILNSCQIEQKDLARIGDVKPSTITNYMKGASDPNQRVLAKWASELNLNLNWLVLGEGEMFGGGEQTKHPTPHIDVALLQEVIEALEEHLQAVKGKLSPTRKAVVVSQLYELIVEQEEQAREPVQMMRLVMGALAKAVNE